MAAFVQCIRLALAHGLHDCLPATVLQGAPAPFVPAWLKAATLQHMARTVGLHNL